MVAISLALEKILLCVLTSVLASQRVVPLPYLYRYKRYSVCTHNTLTVCSVCSLQFIK